MTAAERGPRVPSRSRSWFRRRCFAPVAAAVADRRSPVGVLVGGYLVQVVGMLATAMAIGLEAPLAAYAGAVVASAAVATTRPAQTPLVPGLVRRPEELTAANALTGWIESVSVVASSAATGVLLAVAGPGPVFAVAGVAGLVSVGLAATVRGMRPLAVEEGARRLAGTLAGFRVVARQSAPRLLVALLGAQWVVVGALDILFVVLAVDVLHRDQGWVGYLNMAFGVGGVLAGLAGMALVGRRRLSRPILGGVVLMGAALGLSALSTTPAATVMLVAAVGGGRAVFNLATRTLLQRAVPAEVVGRSLAWPKAWRWRGWLSGRQSCQCWSLSAEPSPHCSAPRRSFRWSHSWVVER
jgi:Major Facilitator Superfamily